MRLLLYSIKLLDGLLETINGDRSLLEQEAKKTFENEASQVKEVKSGDEVLAFIDFDVKEYIVRVLIEDADATILEISGTGIFANLLPNLGVKAVIIDGVLYSLDPSDGQLFELAKVVLEKIGIEDVASSHDLVGKSITFTGIIQPEGHVEFETEFTFEFALTNVLNGV